jgi:hypothetical protein
LGIAERIGDLIDALERGEDFRIEDGEGFVFLRRLKQDFVNMANLLKDYGLALDKRRWLADNMFPLTINVVNREEAPGARVYVPRSATEQICVVYYGICPELENFVTITLWPGESASSKRTYQQIHSLVTSSDYESKVIAFSGNYGLALPNELHPKVDRSVEVKPRLAGVYDWEFAPYLKDFGDTITSHRSPLNFRMLFDSDSGQRKPVYCNLKTTTGTVLELRKEEAKFLIPSLREPDFSYVTRVSIDVFKTIRSNERNPSFHLLIKEKVESNITRYVIDARPSSSSDLVGSLVSYCIYLMFLAERRLRLFSYAEYKKLYELCARKAYRFYRGQMDNSTQLLTPEFVRAAYMPQATRLIKDGVYYVPAFLSRVPDEILELFDSRLAKMEQTLFDHRLVFDERGMRIDVSEFAAEFTKLRFHIAIRQMLFWSPKHRHVANYIQHVVLGK